MRFVILAFIFVFLLSFDALAKNEKRITEFSCHTNNLDESNLPPRAESPFDARVQERVFQRVRELLGVELRLSTPAPRIVRIEDLSDDEYYRLTEYYIGSPRTHGFAFQHNTILLFDSDRIYNLAHEYVHYLEKYYLEGGFQDGWPRWNECRAQTIERHFWPKK